MTKKVNKQMLKVTILVLTFSQMATNGLSPAMSDMAAAFPDVATSTIQMLMTLPGIFVVILSLISAWLTSVFPKKYLIGTGSLCICATAVLGTCFHQSLPVLFAWSALMGIGMGLISALTVSLISDYYEGQEKENLMGLQTSAANVGGMIMTAVGGVLTAIAWNFDYLVYLIAVPGLLLLILFVPKETPVLREQQDKAVATAGRSSAGSLLKNGKVWIFVVISVMLLFLFNAGPTNLSMYVTEFGIGNSVVAGWVATVFLLGGTLMGIAFGIFSKRLGVFTIPLGFLFMVAGFLVMIAKANVACLYIGCLLAGMSISLVSPQCILQASSFCKSSQELAIAAAVIMAASNIGTFLTPQLTNVARAVTGSESTIYRFILALALALVMTIVTLVIFLINKKKK
ncbi:MAG: MFS transporter [Clostridiales bacterium]|nr:MFS transporter [Clostridiales bacterium]